MGDHAYAPYGMRSVEEIYQLTKRRLRDLADRGCKVIILACNTASAIALRRLQQEWVPDYAPDVRVLGIFVPVIEALSAQSWYVRGPSPYAPLQPARTIGFFATQKTVESGAFPAEMKRRAPHVSVIQQPCPRLAEAIEEGREADVLKRGVARYCEQMLAKAGRKKLDLIVLGCTHYPLVQDYFIEALPAETRIMDQAGLVAESLKDYLERHEDLDVNQDAHHLEFLTSGDPDLVSSKAELFSGEKTLFNYINTLHEKSQN
jgi:glutamate racemase